MENNLKQMIEDFNSDKLFIDISPNDDEDIWRDCEKLGEILDDFGAIAPYNGKSWLRYVPGVIGEWHFLRVHYSVVHGLCGTASDEDPDEDTSDRRICFASDFIEAAVNCELERNEEFNSVFT